MDALRTLYADLGFADAQTYVQSGNVLFRSKSTNFGTLSRRIEARLKETFGIQTAVILRTTAELNRVVEGNPFAGRQDIHPAKLVVTFLAEDAAPDAAQAISNLKADPEELYLGGRELYTYYPNGQGKTKLPAARIDRILKTPGTARNWNTVLAMLAMALEMDRRAESD